MILASLPDYAIPLAVLSVACLAWCAYESIALVRGDKILVLERRWVGKPGWQHSRPGERFPWSRRLPTPWHSLRVSEAGRECGVVGRQARTGWWRQRSGRVGANYGKRTWRTALGVP